MSAVKEVSLVPVNSFELETHLADLGVSILRFSEEYNFSKKFADVNDCEFIQAVIIEFIAEVKTDFIAYYSIHNAQLAEGTLIKIKAEEHPVSVTAEAIKNARELNVKVIEPLLGMNFIAGNIFQNSKSFVRHRLYNIKSQLRDFFVKNDPIPEPGKDQFKLLMSTFNLNTIFTLTPIQDKIKDQKDICQLYISNKYATYKKLKSMGYPGILYGWSIDSDRIIVDKKITIDFVNEYFSSHFPFGLATNNFKAKFLKRLQNKLNFAVALYSPIKKILQRFQPDTVLVSSSSTTDAQLLIHISSALNIRVVELTHGMFHDTPILKFQRIPIKLIWNHHQFDLMKKYKPETKCYVIGNPKHDDLLQEYATNPPARTIKEPYILIASTPGNNISISWVTYVRILRDFIDAAKNNEQLVFVLKLHPSEDKERIIQESRQMSAPANFRIQQETSVYQLLYHAEIVMVVTSTVGYEALLFNKKIICFQIPNSDKWMPLNMYNLAKIANDADSINKAISEFLKESTVEIDSSAKAYFVFSDGHAIDKSIEIILKK